MKTLKRIFIATLLALLCNVAMAQTKDTITATYTDSIYSRYVLYGLNCIGGGCIYNLPVVLPPGFTVDNIIYSFNYRALGECNLNQGGHTISLDSCKRSCYSCAIGLPGLCIQEGISIFDSLKECLPPPKCINDTLNFVLDFFRDVGPDTGCFLSCISAEIPWSISVIGTIDSCPTGVINHSYQSSIFSVYPNPANTQLTLYSSFIHPNEVVTVSIINVLGETMLSFPPLLWREAGDEALNIKTIPAGIYFVQLQSQKGQWVGRFVKE